MGKYWTRVKTALQQKNAGFTIVEVLVIAPIVIFSIGALIVMIVSLTGNVLKTRGANTMAFQVQNALTMIEQDIKQSGAFLSTSNVSPIVSPQGINNSTGSFSNVGPNGNMLILNTYATTQNPTTNPESIVFNRNQPNPCGDKEGENTPLTINIVYFVKDGSLWRRTVMPSFYETAGCGTPWQRPSCALGISGTMCKATDVKLVDGVANPNVDFNIQYFTSTDTTSPITNAINAGATPTARQTAMQTARAVEVTINAEQLIAGTRITKSEKVLAISDNDNIVASTDFTAPNITTQPSDRNVARGSSAVFTAAASGPSMTTRWEMSTNRGQTWSTVSGATSPTLTVANVQPEFDGRWYRAVFTNSSASITSEAAALYFYDTSWNTMTLEDGWSNYSSTYTPARYLKTEAGVVVVQGMIKRASTPAAGSVIANLPEGYRPNGYLVFLNTTSSNVDGRVDVSGNGNIIFQVGSGTWYSMDTVMFVPDNGRYKINEVTTWANGWDDYSNIHSSNVHAHVSYLQDSVGRVHFNGLAGGTVFGNGTRIFDIPSQIAAPTTRFNIAASAADGWGSYTVDGNGVNARGVGAAWLSFQNTYYPSSFSSWSNLPMGSWAYYGSYSQPRYTKSSDGIVTLTGMVQGGSYTYDGGIIGILPSGFRPSHRLLIQAIREDGVFMRLDIDNSGNIRYMGSGATSGWVSLDGISFFAG